jgi:NAD(P)-dependent dehydrogenase (short-subunit alcohol dehydrogenase family)
MTTLQNKTALVTGASRGIGRATASALAKAGAHVLVRLQRCGSITGKPGITPSSRRHN